MTTVDAIREQVRARYAEARQRLDEATRFYQQLVLEVDDFRHLIPDSVERAHIIRKAIETCAVWDAETSSAEIRLARLGRVGLTFRMDERA